MDYDKLIHATNLNRTTQIMVEETIRKTILSNYETRINVINSLIFIAGLVCNIFLPDYYSKYIYILNFCIFLLTLQIKDIQLTTKEVSLKDSLNVMSILIIIAGLISIPVGIIEFVKVGFNDKRVYIGVLGIFMILSTIMYIFMGNAAQKRIKKDTATFRENFPVSNH